MAIIGGLAFAALVLFLWLTSHWFGRILAFLAFGAVELVLCAAIGDGAPYTWAYALVGLGAAWCLASAPTWIARSRVIDVSFASQEQGRQLLHRPL